MKTIPWPASKHQGGGFNVADLETTPVLRTAARADVPKPRGDRSSGDNPSRGPTILVPVDFSAVSLKALDHALLLAMRLDASIFILHVVDPIYTGGFVNLVTKQKVRREARRRALERITTLANSHTHEDISVTCVVRDGLPEMEILQLAEKSNVNMIVLGRRPKNPLRRWILGSVSEDILDLATCPVVVVSSRKSAQIPRGWT